MRKLHSSFVYLGLITFTPIITNPPYWDKFIAETRWSYVLLTLRHHVSCTCNLMKILAKNALIFFMDTIWYFCFQQIGSRTPEVLSSGSWGAVRWVGCGGEAVRWVVVGDKVRHKVWWSWLWMKLGKEDQDEDEEAKHEG